MGNIIEKGPRTENSTVIGYGEEGFINPDTDFYFVNNTIVTDRNPTTFFEIAKGTPVALIANNIIAGTGHPIIGFTDTEANVIETDTSFFHFAVPANYDYHITAPFPGFTSAVDLGSVNGFLLTPTSEYTDLADSTPRPFANQVGAFALASNSVALRDPSDQADGFAYPNPFVRETRISVPFIGTVAELTLHNAAGALVRRELFQNTDGTIVFDRGTLPAGIYYYRIHSTNGMAQCHGSFVIVP